MNEGSLRDDLLSIPGVEGAEVEGSPDKPAGLRIRIAEGADQRAVGSAIRRVLTSHGLGTDTKLPGEPETRDDDPEAGPHVVEVPDDAAGDASPEAEPEIATGATAVAVADEPGGTEDMDETTVDDTPAEDSEPIIDLTDGALDAEDASGGEGESAPQPVEPVHQPPPTPPVAGHDVRVARLASVAVEEGRDGITVSVATTSGERVRQAAASTEGGVEAAVVRATTRLALPDAPEPSVVDIDDRRVEGVDIVMIVLDVDGVMHAGSAVVAAGRAFALGRATWAALTL